MWRWGSVGWRAKSWLSSDLRSPWYLYIVCRVIIRNSLKLPLLLQLGSHCLPSIIRGYLLRVPGGGGGEDGGVPCLRGVDYWGLIIVLHSVGRQLIVVPLEERRVFCENLVLGFPRLTECQAEA